MSSSATRLQRLWPALGSSWCIEAMPACSIGLPWKADATCVPTSSSDRADVGTTNTTRSIACLPPTDVNHHSRFHRSPSRLFASSSSGSDSSGESGADAAAALASSDSSDDASDEDNDLTYYNQGDEDDEDEDSEQWAQYREVQDGEDDDADAVDPQIPENRYVLNKELRSEGLNALGGDKHKDSEEWGDGEAGPGKVTDDGRMALRDVYETKLDEHVQKMTALLTDLHTGERKKMTMKEKLDVMLEEGAKDDMQVQGLPHIPSLVVEPGIAQLEALLASKEWHMTLVDVKMTTKQTPQGKKTRFSSMVMVGNLNGKAGYGIGAAKEVNDSIFKALRMAVLGAINFPLYRKHTVYYPSKSKFIRTKISIFPRPADFGLSASPIIMEACELIGIQNLTVKTHNSRNIRNVVKGFFQALANIPTAAEVAQAKRVYLRERVTRKLFTKEFM